MLISKRRMVEPSIIEHRDFRRADYVARELYLLIIVSIADDEGRFEADPDHLLEAVFSRRHDATTEQVRAALDWWADPARGNIILYGDDNRYGFLRGWFEHQYIDKRVRSESTLPSPPVVVASWAQAEHLVELCKVARSQERERFPVREAIRWFESLPENSSNHRKIAAELAKLPVISASRVRTPSPSPSPKGGAHPRPRKRGHDAAPPTAPPALFEQVTSAATDDERPPALAPEVRSAARAFYGTTEPPGGWERYDRQLAEQLAIAGDRLTPQRVAAAFDIESPLRPRPGEWADKFLLRLIADRERSPTDTDEQEIETGRKRASLALQLERAHRAGDEDMIESIEEQLRAL